MRLAPKSSLLIGCLVLTEIVLASGLQVMLNQSDTEIKREEEARLFVATTQKLMIGYFDANKLVVDYLLRRNIQNKRRYFEKVSAVRKLAGELQSRLENDPVQSSLLKSTMEDLFTIDSEVKKAFIAAEQLPPGISAKQVANKMELTTSKLSLELAEHFAELVYSKKQVLESSPGIQRRFREQMTNLLDCCVFITAILSVTIAIFMLKQINSRLNIVLDNTARIKAALPLNKQLAGDDEIAELDQQFHQMAKHIDAATRKERTILNFTMDVISSINRDGIFVAVSQASEIVWGYAPQELIGKPVSSIAAAPNKQKVREELFEIRSHNSGGNLDFDIKAKTGSILHSAWKVNWSESEQAFFCISHDVTMRKRNEDLVQESESKIKAVIDKMPVGVLLAGADQSIEFANSRLCEMLSYRLDEIIGQPITEPFPQSANLAVSNRGADKVTETLAVGKAGEVAVEFSTSLLRLTDEPKILAIALDITERYELQKMRQAIVSMVSHDLRTPLTNLGSHFELMIMGVFGEVSEAATDSAQKAKENVDSLISFINDLLDLEKMESGNLSLDIKPVYAEPLFEETLDTSMENANRKEISISFGKAPNKVLADFDRIVQVLVILVSNAIKFSPRHETVSLLCIDQGEFSLFQVVDRGLGIPEEQTILIFEKFKQSEASTNGGLGLSICKLIIEQHGGQIGVDSVEGSGSTFWFTLPNAMQSN